MSTFEERRKFVEELRVQWNSMWRERIDDKVKAEGISGKDYSQLFVERGTVIMATRKFMPLDFYQIVQEYKKEVGGEAMPTNPSVGGWNKFIRNNLKKPQNQARRRRNPPESVKKEKQQLKKSGRGWLHNKK